MRYALVGLDNVVQNVVEWDGISPYDIPDGFQLVQSDTADIGDDL